MPHFRSVVYDASARRLGIVESIFGELEHLEAAVKCDIGIYARSFRRGQKVYIEPEKIIRVAQVVAKIKKRYQKLDLRREFSKGQRQRMRKAAEKEARSKPNSKQRAWLRRATAIQGMRDVLHPWIAARI
mmetsp:Transcript_25888/g.40531  ORF Transcript_25888/g.40531 Transcript_25888/m.40531 type:complete len:130 (+) Transcript_25888:282-671(+)